MIDRLKKIFPSAILEKNILTNERHLYTIYASEYAQEKFAIRNEELTVKEEELLAVLFTADTEKGSFQPDDNELYTYLVEGGSFPPALHQFSPFRLFHLEGKKLYENKVDLYETLHYYFDEPVKTVFVKTHSLLILVPEQDADEFKPEELAGVLATDLLLDVFVYSGRRIHADEDIRTVYNQEDLLFKQAQTLFPKERTFKDYEILPFVVPLLDTYQQKQLYHYTFAGLEKEIELIDTVYYFFLCNLNTSFTAKELHMHRNTLQYRLDKLMERIGIDIKQFPNATALYILIKKMGE
ncbi:hypothetical protein D7Z54_22910 [Salibacterium salarium]|uniref:PucR C-terminal helix-turn-helix domain-containing protein n=1 Tax=Salibacterium salarium TaxID=284579 RepID=A0A3R9WPU1_9BACI|nr:helix-turn-helix domain-containing protein [Salibacterium salarium]RSL31000.1 hypothetical protein D7Z54_22910 [Salibacterium salarium]